MAQARINKGDVFLSLPLLKFSYATTSAVQGHLNWTHLPQRDSMYVVFDDIKGQDLQGRPFSRRFMKVVRGGEIMEYVGLDDLVSQAYADDDRAGPDLQSDSSRVVLMIIKKPLMALRYRLGDGNVRRIQMNFFPESGYEKALSIFRQICIPIRDRNESQPQPQIKGHGISYHSQPPGLEASYSQTHSQNVSGTMSYEDVKSTNQPLAHATNPSAHAIRPSAHPVGYSAATSYVQPMGHHNLPPLYHGERNYFHRHLDVSSPSIQGNHYRSHDSSTSIPLPPHHTEFRDISTSHGRLEKNIVQRSEPVYNGAITVAFASRPSNESSEAGIQRDMVMDPPERIRPFTSPIHYTQQDSLAQLYPPKRALPFPMLPPKCLEAEPIEDEPVKNALQTKPKDVKLDKAKGGTKGKAKAQKGKEPNAAIKSTSKSSKVVRSSARARATTAPKLPPGSAPKPGARSSKATNTKKLSPGSNRKASPIAEEDLGESSDHLPTTTTRVLPKGMYPATVKAEAAVPPTVLTEPFMDIADEFIRKHAPRPAPVAPLQTPISDLRDYAKIPESERIEAINEELMRHLEDPAFVTYCQDVEKAWMRAGLGV